MGVPLSAKQVEEQTSAGPYGKPVSVATVSKVYRDRAGRMRIESRIDINDRESARVATLLDPTANYSYQVLIEPKIAIGMGGPISGEFRVGFPAEPDKITLPTPR